MRLALLDVPPLQLDELRFMVGSSKNVSCIGVLLLIFLHEKPFQAAPLLISEEIQPKKQGCHHTYSLSSSGDKPPSA
jgi:hypothetical protein